MENNESPYIYEKPLSPKRPKRTFAIAAASLAGIGSVVGGTAFASAVVGIATASQDITPISSASGQDPQILTAEPTQLGELPTETPRPVANTSIPIASSKPNSSVPQVQLPAIAPTAWGNLSSATPSAGSWNGTNGAGEYEDGKDYDDEHEDREDHDDEHEDRGDHDDD